MYNRKGQKWCTIPTYGERSWLMATWISNWNREGNAILVLQVLITNDRLCMTRPLGQRGVWSHRTRA